MAGIVTEDGQPASAAPSGMRCADCLNFQAINDDGGFCKANPPMPMLIPKQAAGIQLGASQGFALQGVFPTVPSSEWCAAFEDVTGEPQRPTNDA